MAKHQDLRIFGDAIYSMVTRKFVDTANQGVEEFERHGEKSIIASTVPGRVEDLGLSDP